MLASNLSQIIGEEATVSLLEEFAGTRVYVPRQVRENSRLTRAIGREAAQALCDRFASDTIRVPLGRELRAKHYRHRGLSDARIAARLGLTESGVRTLFKRMGSEGLQHDQE